MHHQEREPCKAKIAMINSFRNIIFPCYKSTSQTLRFTRCGTKYCNGPSASYGKNASKDNIIALPQRKLAWFALGIFGTIVVNVIRIFSLSWYALKVTTDVTLWEEFHSVAGEIMFLPWLFAFLMIVAVVENKKLKRLDEQNNQK